MLPNQLLLTRQGCSAANQVERDCVLLAQSGKRDLKSGLGNIKEACMAALRTTTLTATGLLWGLAKISKRLKSILVAPVAMTTPAASKHSFLSFVVAEAGSPAPPAAFARG